MNHPDRLGEPPLTGIRQRGLGQPVQIRSVGGEARLSVATVSTCTDDTDPDITVVFCHGLGLHSAVWAPQIDGLRRRHRRVRVVSYDHRGHGGSAPVDPASCSVTQLGDDLATVLAAVAPGPVVLVGHSLGGMAILAFAASHPEVVAQRVAGVALLATAAAQITSVGIARLLGGPVVPALRVLAHHRPHLLSHGWELSRRALSPVIGRPWWSATPVVTAAMSTILTAGAMIHHTDVATLVGFLADVATSDQTRGLRELESVPTLIMCGTRDRVLPIQHSYRIAAALSCGELVLVPGAGHMIGLDSPAEVNTHLGRLVGRALAHAAPSVPVVSDEAAPCSPRRSAPTGRCRREALYREKGDLFSPAVRQILANGAWQ